MRKDEECLSVSQTTNVTLLEKIIEGDEISWNNFSEIYSPLIRNCGRLWELDENECDELIQDVMIAFFNTSKTFKYDRSKGRFRSYLRNIARSCTFAILKRRTVNPLSDKINEPLLDFAFDEKWDTEWHDFLCNEALKILERDMEAHSYRSFYMYVIEEMPPVQVAKELGITVNAVYVNKCRALENLRRTIRDLDVL